MSSMCRAFLIKLSSCGCIPSLLLCLQRVDPWARASGLVLCTCLSAHARRGFARESVLVLITPPFLAIAGTRTWLPWRAFSHPHLSSFVFLPRPRSRFVSSFVSDSACTSPRCFVVLRSVWLGVRHPSSLRMCLSSHVGSLVRGVLSRAHDFWSRDSTSCCATRIHPLDLAALNVTP
jgi:hypothetical protein